VLDGRIVSLEQRGTMAIARVDCGIAFIVHVSPGAVRALELTAGTPRLVGVENTLVPPGGVKEKLKSPELFKS